MSKAALWNDDAGELEPREAAVQSERPSRTPFAEWMQRSAGADARERDAHATIDVLEDWASDRSRLASERNKDPDSALALAKAIDAMERRTSRSKRRAAEALAPFNRILERAELDDAPGRVADLASRVSHIETRLIDRLSSVEENPVHLALARLESRLDTFGQQHSLAEVVALQHTLSQLPKPATPADSIQRLEDKLDAILRAVQTRQSESSLLAVAAAQDARRRTDRRLGDAIDEIARRQQALEFDEAEPHDARPPASRKIERAMRSVRRPQAEEPALKAIRGEISDLVAKVDGLCRDLTVQREAPAKKIVEFDLLRADIAKMSRAIHELAASDNLPGVIGSVAALAERLESSAGFAIGETTSEALRAVVADARKAFADMVLGTSVGSLATRLDAIGARIDDLAQTGDASSVSDLRELIHETRLAISNAAAKPSASERIANAIASLNGLLDAPAPTADADIAAAIEEIRDLVANPPSDITVTRIADALYALDARIGNAIEDGTAAHAKAGRLPSDVEDLLRDLSKKMDAVQSPGADQESLAALQNQISVLSARFEHADDSLSKLNALQASMQDVFAHLEQTRASVETSAAEAAREVLRIAVQDGQGHRAEGSASSIEAMRSIQHAAEARTGSALSAVQQTLTKVVDRLSSMEAEVAEVRAGRKPSPAPARPIASSLGDLSLGIPDLPLGQTFEKTRVAPAPAKAPAKALDEDRETGKADFIAAARRAAKTVQSSVSAPVAKRSTQTKKAADLRVALVEQSRDYIARHKAPMLLGIAALFIIVGTLSVTHFVGPKRLEAKRTTQAPKIQLAEASAPATPRVISTYASTEAFEPGAKAVVASVAAPTSVAPTAEAPDAQTQSAPVAGLPTFATRLPAAPPPPTIPAKLRSMAEAGDANAEYVLGMQYAEGKSVERNFTTAADWYQKAAEKGVAPAQYRLASLFEKGLGVGKDKAKARSLYLQAAEAGNPRAMHNLAVLLADGDGKPDYQNAATWFRKAAQYGMEDSQYNLAILLARGLGMQQSLVQSYQWFAIAATQDDPDAAKKRDEVASKLGTADLAVAKALAASFRPRKIDVAATDVPTPPGGWDGAPAASPLNSTRPKFSSL